MVTRNRQFQLSTIIKRRTLTYGVGFSFFGAWFWRTTGNRLGLSSTLFLHKNFNSLFGTGSK